MLGGRFLFFFFFLISFAFLVNWTILHTLIRKFPHLSFLTSPTCQTDRVRGRYLFPPLSVSWGCPCLGRPPTPDRPAQCRGPAQSAGSVNRTRQSSLQLRQTKSWSQYYFWFRSTSTPILLPSYLLSFYRIFPSYVSDWLSYWGENILLISRERLSSPGTESSVTWTSSSPARTASSSSCRFTACWS